MEKRLLFDCLKRVDKSFFLKTACSHYSFCIQICGHLQVQKGVILNISNQETPLGI